MTLPGGYLVQYGRSAFVGRFAANGVTAARGENIVVETVRGLEVGLVLATVPPPTPPDGLTVRPATVSDSSTDIAPLLARAEVVASDSPVTFVDAESLVDGTLLLHVLAWGEANLSPVCDQLSAEFGRPVRVFDVSQLNATIDPPTGCGKPDCSSEKGGGCGTGGGCSTGGCSKGSVKSADDLTAYFTDLRHQMDDRRTPLH